MPVDFTQKEKKIWRDKKSIRNEKTELYIGPGDVTGKF